MAKMTSAQINRALAEGLRSGRLVAARGETGELIYAASVNASLAFRRKRIDTKAALHELDVTLLIPWYNPN